MAVDGRPLGARSKGEAAGAHFLPTVALGSASGPQPPCAAPGVATIRSTDAKAAPMMAEEPRWQVFEREFNELSIVRPQFADCSDKEDVTLLGATVGVRAGTAVA